MFKDSSSSQEDKNYSTTKIPGFENLSQRFSGALILPGNDVYDQLSETYARKGSPALILRSQNTKDVSEAIKYARENSLLISIRSGGHGLPGFATNNGGLIIDLSAINKIEVIDKNKGIVRIGAGALWGDVAKFLDEYNLVISSGDTKSVGVGGLTLGGGIGLMVRKYGLAIDSLVSAEIVISDGRILKVNDHEYSDLFWAIKGGGGNFGVVTHFEFVAQHVGKIVAGNIQYGIENLQSILKSWWNYMRTADEKLSSTVKIMPALFGNPPAIFISFCYADYDSVEARNVIQPLANLGQVIHQDIKEMNYPDLLEEPMHPPDTIRIVIKNTFAKTFSDEMISAVSELNGQAIQVRSLSGKLNHINPDSTAFPFRNSEVLISAGFFIPISASESEKSEALKAWDKIKSFGTGAYVNFLSEDENIKDIYPEEKYVILAIIKKKYDPENIFNRNYNIKL